MPIYPLRKTSRTLHTSAQTGKSLQGPNTNGQCTDPSSHAPKACLRVVWRCNWKGVAGEMWWILPGLCGIYSRVVAAASALPLQPDLYARDGRLGLNFVNAQKRHHIVGPYGSCSLIPRPSPAPSFLTPQRGHPLLSGPARAEREGWPVIWVWGEGVGRHWGKVREGGMGGGGFNNTDTSFKRSATALGTQPRGPG
jgi:hypothetical protein